MLDLTSSKLLILGLVALIVVGPKDLPLLLRTIGKYVGIIRRHANEFRAQFDEAMRDQELANLKAEMEAVKRDVSATVHSATRDVKSEMAAASEAMHNTIHAPIPAVTPPVAAPSVGEPVVPPPSNDNAGVAALPGHREPVGVAPSSPASLSPGVQAASDGTKVGV